MKLKTETIKEVKEVYEKYLPEKDLNLNAFWFNLAKIGGELDQYLNDHPKEREKIIKLLEKEEL